MERGSEPSCTVSPYVRTREARITIDGVAEGGTNRPSPESGVNEYTRMGYFQTKEEERGIRLEE